MRTKARWCLALLLSAGAALALGGCKEPGCTRDAQCDDGVYCNGREQCEDSVCVAGVPPCPSGETCSESAGRCDECQAAADCDDRLFCNGAETCAGGRCRAGAPACPLDLLCNEAQDICEECQADLQCDDGLFCNGAETCAVGRCRAGLPPCPGQGCSEALGQCQECRSDRDCDDGSFCTGAERCADGRCEAGTAPCGQGELCVEQGQACEPACRPYGDMLARYFTHDIAMGGHHNVPCGACHHEGPSAMVKGCTACHGREEGGFRAALGAFAPKLKEAMHTGEGAGGKKGCRHCHDERTAEGLWDCGQCHLGF